MALSALLYSARLGFLGVQIFQVQEYILAKPCSIILMFFYSQRLSSLEVRKTERLGETERLVLNWCG
jgi:hypothetical protein